MVLIFECLSKNKTLSDSVSKILIFKNIVGLGGVGEQSPGSPRLVVNVLRTITLHSSKISPVCYALCAAIPSYYVLHYKLALFQKSLN